MRGFLILVTMLIGSPAAAQVSYPPADTSALAARVDQAVTKADTAASKAAAACQPGAMMPPMESVGGSAGSGDVCRLANAVQPRISRTISGTTSAAGTGVVTWPSMSSVPKLTVTPYVAATATQVPVCYPVVGTVTASGATIACYMTQTILGLGLVPFARATAGVTFDVLALPAS